MMIKETNYRLFYNEFSIVMKKHFHKMDCSSYQNKLGGINTPTLDEQTSFFMDAFLNTLMMDQPKHKQWYNSMVAPKDIATFNLNYREPFSRAAERFIIANIKTPIYI